MAKDLIPPPSPAGRPSRPSSEALELEANARAADADPIADAAIVVEGATPPPRVDRLPPDSPHLPRFRFLLGALIGLALAVVGILALTLANGTDSFEAPQPEQWSAWQPTATDGVAAAKQIADHVGPRYRGSDKAQLVAVRAGGLEIAGLPLTIALRGPGVGGKIELFDGDGIIYTLNGLGERGSIRLGKPSEARGLLTRREALELALYTFKYIDDVENVVVLLPPPRTVADPAPSASATPAASPAAPGAPSGATGASGVAPTTTALFFRAGDLQDRLDIPLGFTVPEGEAPTATQLAKGPEVKTINGLTLPNLFTASFTQSQDARAFLVLDPPAG